MVKDLIATMAREGADIEPRRRRKPSRDFPLVTPDAKAYMLPPPVRETGVSLKGSFIPMMNESMQAAARRVASLYSPEHEHDACGVGFIAQVRRGTLQPGVALRD